MINKSLHQLSKQIEFQMTGVLSYIHQNHIYTL